MVNILDFVVDVTSKWSISQSKEQTYLVDICLFCGRYIVKPHWPPRIDICALANCEIVQQDCRKSKDLLTAFRLLFGFVGKTFWIVVLRGSGQQQSHQM